MSKAIESSRYETRKISELQNWSENPRTITDKEFGRLKAQLEHLGVYKPLLINQNNIVLGGNMRLRALKELGVEEVMCSVVLTDNKHQMIEYALSDNDEMGVTDQQKVAELVTLDPIKSELFAIQTGKLKSIDSVLKDHSPDVKPPTKYACPECGHENTLDGFRVS